MCSQQSTERIGAPSSVKHLWCSPVSVCATRVFSVLSAKFTVVSLNILLSLGIKYDSVFPVLTMVNWVSTFPISIHQTVGQLSPSVDDQMVTEQLLSTTIVARIENDVGIKLEKDRDHSNRFDIVDKGVEMEEVEVDKKHISASVMKNPMLDGVLEIVLTVSKIPGMKGLSGETTTNVHNL